MEIADAQKVKGLAPLACKTDKIDSLALAVLSHRDLVPAIWLPGEPRRWPTAGSDPRFAAQIARRHRLCAAPASRFRG